ncbi:hypothetical protein Bca52824_089816 [Brassica carinata]|uniref:Protein kinase domain-containing protein n=1 Tax=Brassica carinata TaxID=52824 RepID=A0A8X7TG20_BRACI|nr:hypothetical protein Bca52824_089816 [Brassica carinata]
MIGSGGFGKIHKAPAELENGETVAVKKILLKDDLMSNKSFGREVKTPGRIKHRHLVKLMGYYSSKSEGLNLLIYEYMENGSVWDWLSESGCKHDICSSSTKRYVDSKACGHFKPQKTPPGVAQTEVDVFVDVETMKFRTLESVYLLQNEISSILDRIDTNTGDKKNK